MNVLFIHQNFPGQYLNLARWLISHGHTVVGVGEETNINSRGALPGMYTIGYKAPPEASAHTPGYLKKMDTAVLRARTISATLLRLRKRGFQPDVIAVHPGWGEGLFLKDIYPHTPVVMFCEHYPTAHGADVCFDKEYPIRKDIAFSMRIDSAVQLVSLSTADVCVSPTHWQASLYPTFMKQRIQVVHDGINTDFMRPDSAAFVHLQHTGPQGRSNVLEANALNETQGTLRLSATDKVITYVARNLEPYRGFHSFMRAIPYIQAIHPNAHILIIGGEDVSYSAKLPDGKSYKEHYIAELQDKIDFSFLHFLDRVPYAVLRQCLCISSAHIYLTYPFVLSWSMLEAMACECLLVASRTAPVQEVIEDGKNGLLADFFDYHALAELVSSALSHPADFLHLRREARQTVVRNYAYKDCLIKQEQLLLNTAAGHFSDHIMP